MFSFNSIISFPYYLILSQKNINSIFKNKRIAIIGPADSVFDQKCGDYINAFDLITRVSLSYRLFNNTDHVDYIGNRTDILFSPLAQITEYDKNIDYMIGYIRKNYFKHSNSTVHNTLLKNYRNFKRKIYFIPAKKYNQFKEILNGHKPTTGFMALYSIIDSEFKELYISGFTFFRTGYIKGYRDNVNVQLQLNRFKNSKKGHNPELEFKIIKSMIENKRGKINLDNFLKNALRSNY